MSLLPVHEALTRILKSVAPVGTEFINIHDALGRVTSDDIRSNLTQPPFDASAMDGYAVRFSDIDNTLTVVGESQAGKSFEGKVTQNQAIRIFTGAPMAKGTDTVIMQENCTRKGDELIINEYKTLGDNIRHAGNDVKKGQTIIIKGTRLNSRHIALLAAANVAELSVYGKVKVALLSTGDELVDVGSAVGPDQIINSNIPLFEALIIEQGGIPVNLGTAKDNRQDLNAKISKIKNVDMVISIGGVSVGDYDIVQDVLVAARLKVDFWKVAMQPGKPLVYGDFNGIPFFGMPGNPASAYVCAVNFMVPALHIMQGRCDIGFKVNYATVGHDLSAGNSRINYMRAHFTENDKGEKIVTAMKSQGSSKLSTLANANCLLIRDINTPPSKAGESVRIVILNT